MSNMQEVFDKIVTHLRQQGSPSYLDPDESGICAYRSPDGKMCAVGCLILDEAYSPNLESNIVENSLVKAALKQSGIKLSTPLMNMLIDLQETHDNYRDMWEDKFQIIATRYNLEYKATK